MLYTSLPIKHPHPRLPPSQVPSNGRCPCSASLAAEGLLRGVDHVEEAVFVPLLLVDLRDGRGHGHHAVLVDQQEEGLCGVQLQPAPGGGHSKCSDGCLNQQRRTVATVTTDRSPALHLQN